MQPVQSWTRSCIKTGLPEFRPPSPEIFETEMTSFTLSLIISELLSPYEDELGIAVECSD